MSVPLPAGNPPPKAPSQRKACTRDADTHLGCLPGAGPEGGPMRSRRGGGSGTRDPQSGWRVPQNHRRLRPRRTRCHRRCLHCFSPFAHAHAYRHNHPHNTNKMKPRRRTSDSWRLHDTGKRHTPPQMETTHTSMGRATRRSREHNEDNAGRGALCHAQWLCHRAAPRRRPEMN